MLLSWHTRPAAADAVASQITGLGRHAMAIQADMAAEDQSRRLFAVADVQFGRLDALANNAGIMDKA